MHRRMHRRVYYAEYGNYNFPSVCSFIRYLYHRFTGNSVWNFGSWQCTIFLRLTMQLCINGHFSEDRVNFWRKARKAVKKSRKNTENAPNISPWPWTLTFTLSIDFWPWPQSIVKDSKMWPGSTISYQLTFDLQPWPSQHQDWPRVVSYSLDSTCLSFHWIILNATGFFPMSHCTGFFESFGCNSTSDSTYCAILCCYAPELSKRTNWWQKRGELLDIPSATAILTALTPVLQ